MGWLTKIAAIDRREEIDLIITSLASAKDPHGDLNRFHEIVRSSEEEPVARCGDVQYCSYDEHGPVVATNAMRPFTLFELDDLAEWAKHNEKKILLVAGPCSECGLTRTDALLPLLKNPRLKVWTQLVLDLNTAEELILS